MATKKKENVVPEIIDNVEALEAKMKAMREAQKKFATYTQEQVDCIFRAAALAANQARIPLAKMAVAETGMGVVEDKVIKNNYAAEYIYNAYKDTKTCGVVEEDKAEIEETVAEDEKAAAENAAPSEEKQVEATEEKAEEAVDAQTSEEEAPAEK